MASCSAFRVAALFAAHDPRQVVKPSHVDAGFALFPYSSQIMMVAVSAAAKQC